MAFRISRLAKTEEDAAAVIPQLAEIQLKAWLTVPLYALLYPGPPSTHPTVVSLSRTRHANSLVNDPWCHFLVAWVPVESASASAEQEWKAVAFVNESPTTTDQAEIPAVNVALASSFWELIVATRQHHTAKLGGHVNVEILATLPEYHGRGAGRALLDQVLAEADARGLTAVLEASQEGLRLYRSVGFVPEEDGKWDIWVDLGRWEGGGDKGADWKEGNKQGGEVKANEKYKRPTRVQVEANKSTSRGQQEYKSRPTRVQVEANEEYQSRRN
ncbi:hypothetical protein DV735_g4060, partial [Chaetothyriales sp. CBS 134920]